MFVGRILNVLGVKEWLQLLSNNFAGVYQCYSFLCHEHNLVPFLTVVVSFDVGKKPEGGKKDITEKFSTFGVCVCINKQEKYIAPAKKNSPKQICILRNLWYILDSWIWMFVLPPQIWDMTKPRAVHLQDISSSQIACYCSLMLLFLNAF